MSDDGQSTFRKRGTIALYAPFMPILLIALGSLVFALAKTSALERDMRIAATQNMLWVVTQTQMEIMALALAASAPDQDDEQVSQRYDLTLSRLTLLQQGPQARYLDRIGHLATVQAIHDDLVSLDPLEQGSGPELNAALFELGRDLHPRINRIANDVMTHDWDQSAERLDAYRATQRLVILAVGFAFSASLAMSWLLLRNQGRLYRTELQRLSAASLLEEERNISAMYRDFAAMVSHQMRTPLSLIDSAMHRLVRKGDAVRASDVAERREVVHEAVRRLTRLLDTVLLLGRLDNDQLRGKLTSIAMHEAAGAAIAETQEHHPDRVLRLSCAESRTFALGDPHLVAHILDNLLSNAIRYAPSHLPIEVRVFMQGEFVACAVTDQGPGIAQEDRSHLFERYFRGTGRVGGQGTGLGLALARELAELQGGRISVETWAGKGSVFTLWLPTVHEAKDHDRA